MCIRDRSCTTRATIPATVRQDNRRNTVTAVSAMFLASHAQVSSNRYVHFAPGRAQGTCATSTPWSGHCTRGAADSRNVRVVPVSTVRHRLVPTPASYPGHDRRHCAHLPPDRASGRTDTTRTSPSPSGSGCMVTSPTTMPWTPINCPNTLVLRMPCLLRRSGPLARPKTTGRRGMSPQTARSGTHNNVTSAERTVCGMLTGAGLAGIWHHSRAHRFFSGTRWDVQQVGLILATLVMEILLGPNAAIMLAIDETLTRRRGPKVFAASWWH